jgi:hypothetical protein
MKPTDKALPGRVSESPGRNTSELIGGLEKKKPRRLNPLYPGEGSRRCRSMTDEAHSSGGVVGTAR